MIKKKKLSTSEKLSLFFFQAVAVLLNDAPVGFDKSTARSLIRTVSQLDGKVLRSIHSRTDHFKKKEKYDAA